MHIKNGDFYRNPHFIPFREWEQKNINTSFNGEMETLTNIFMPTRKKSHKNVEVYEKTTTFAPNEKKI